MSLADDWLYLLLSAVLVVIVWAVMFFRQQARSRRERALVEQLQVADKHKDEFLANTSHELKAPLNGIVALAQSLKDGVAGPLPEAALQRLDMVVKSGQRLSNRVNDIMDFGYLKRGQVKLVVKPVDLRQLVEGVVALLTPTIGNKPVNIVSAVHPGLPAVMADVEALHDVMANLLANAIKFSESGQITLSAMTVDERVMVSVSDKGCGITEQQLQRIFTAFEPDHGGASRPLGGCGLGLPIVAKLLELHGSEIEVDSVPGKGSNFRFALQASDERPDAGDEPLVVRRAPILNEAVTDGIEVSPGEIQPTLVGAQPRERAFRLLLVDDEQENRQSMFDQLCVAGYQVTLASSGRKALKLVELEGPFDMVLLDIMMPGMSGYEVCQRLRQKHAVNDLPIVFLTAKNQVADLVHSFDVGGNDFLNKPVDKLELLTRVRTHLALLDINRNLENMVEERTEALEKQTEQLRQAKDARSDFLARMSHEIRTPMNSVIGLSSLALKSGLTPSQRDCIEKVQDAGRSLLGLINDILDFSKIEAGKLTLEQRHFGVAETALNALGLCSLNAHDKGLELVCDLDPQVPRMLEGDPLRLRQIIVNLVNNGVTFTQTGAVCLKMQVGKQQGSTITLHCSVQDTGIGMNQAQQVQLFESFEQSADSDRFQRGTGLGLTISRQLSGLLGGRIWVESKEGVGSTFHFTVTMARVGNELQWSTQTDFAGMRALVVDDQPLAAEALCRQLNALGFEVSVAVNPDMAVKTLRDAVSDNISFDLALVDWSLPVMDGVDLVDRLRSTLTRPIPCLLMAGLYQMEQARNKAQRHGLQTILPKPHDMQMLIHAINTAIGAGEAMVTTQPQTQTEQKVPDWSGRHILLAEDNPINRQVALGFLADTNADVETANNGLEALEKLDSGHFDLVLMDMEMPQMDGLTATRTIRQQRNIDAEQLPVVAFTARVMTEDIERFREAGINDFIGKPFEPEQFYTTLATFLNGPEAAATGCIRPGASVHTAPLSVLEQLHNIESLNPAKALDQLKGREALYINLIKDFLADQQGMPQQMQHWFAEQNGEELYRQVHTLKSAAAYIGADELSTLSAVMEDALKADEQDNKTLNLLCDVLQDTLSALATVNFSQEPAHNLCVVQAVKADDSNKPALLFIDDTPQMLTLLCNTFAGDYRIDTAAYGEHGIAKATAVKPDLVISDLVMPGLNGYQVCQQLKSNADTRHIPVILLTTKADIDSRRQGWQAGADAYVTKPFDEQELKLQVQALLDNRRLLQSHFTGRKAVTEGGNEIWNI